MSDLTLEQRDSICKAILSDYAINETMKQNIKTSISKNANANLSDSSLNKMLDSDTNIYSHINVLEKSLDNFSGYIYELVCVYEYNMYRNNKNVTTILNPDSTSKTDLLHVIDTAKGRFTVAGGDVKSGSPRYVLDQYEKLLKNKYNVPFIDYSGHLTTNKENLTPKQRERLEYLLKTYPNKKPVPSIFTNLDIKTIQRDVLAYFATGFLPSEKEYFNKEFHIKTFTQNVEARKDLIALSLSHKNHGEPVYWEDFRNKLIYSRKISSNWGPYYEGIKKYKEKVKKEQEKRNKLELEIELLKYKIDKFPYEPHNAREETNNFKRIIKHSRNRFERIIRHSERKQKIQALKYRMETEDYSMSVKEIYEDIEKKKRRKRKNL